MRRAFTIVEIVIAISLLALVAALAIPASMTLLTSEGRRSGLFACESAVRAARAAAMRDRVFMELAVVERDGVWDLVSRTYEPARDDQSTVPGDDTALSMFAQAGEEDGARWETLVTLPPEFSFRFEPMPTLLDGLSETPQLETMPGLGEEPEPMRVALVLPSGVVEGITSWRLVTARSGSEDRVDLLSVERWTGAINATREVADSPMLDDRDGNSASPEAPPISESSTR